MKIAAFDVDGTLFIDHQLDPRVLKAIASWRAAGHLAVAATGKSLDSCRQVFSRFGVEMDYLLMFNATVITDASYNILYNQSLPQKVVNAVVDHFQTVSGINLYATSVEGADALVYGSLDDSQHSVISCARKLTPQQLEQERVVLLSAWSQGNSRILAELEDWVQTHLDVETSVNSGFLDIMPPGHNKGAGLTWLIDHLGLDPQTVELFTFGDSHNDQSMHALATKSFSFPHADRAVQEAVTHVVPDVTAGLELLQGKRG